jgi:uncharacterized membrane protein (UPF0127 family)
MQKERTEKIKLAHRIKALLARAGSFIDDIWSVRRFTRRIAIVVMLAVAIVFGGSLGQSDSCQTTYRSDVMLTINSGSFIAERVSSPTERSRGLSGRACIPSDTAMLFEFEQPEPHGIWMKSMRFPIDILWLDTDKRIVHIERAVEPSTYPEVFRPSTPALYVIETQSGATLGITVGDSVSFSQ